MSKSAKMTPEDRAKANDTQFDQYSLFYDYFWRYNKLLLINKNLEDRESIKESLESHHGIGFFPGPESYTYFNLTNGRLADALSETVMYCEDYFAALKFFREKYYFARNIISYSAGQINNVASATRNISRDTATKLFMITASEFLNKCTPDEDEISSEIDFYEEGLDILAAKHRSIVSFFESHQDAHVQYKHGLKIALSGLGCQASKEFVAQAKSSTDPACNFFVMQNRPIAEMAKKGAIMIPSFGTDEIRRNLTELAQERNLMFLEIASHGTMKTFISVAADICQLLACLARNRAEIIHNKNSNRIRFLLPQQEPSKCALFSFSAPSGMLAPDIEIYKFKL